jgi:hypothetical protein
MAKAKREAHRSARTMRRAARWVARRTRRQSEKSHWRNGSLSAAGQRLDRQANLARKYRAEIYCKSASGHPDISVVHSHGDVHCLKFRHISGISTNRNNQRSFGDFVKQVDHDPKVPGPH